MASEAPPQRSAARFRTLSHLTFAADVGYVAFVLVWVAVVFLPDEAWGPLGLLPVLALSGVTFGLTVVLTMLIRRASGNLLALGVRELRWHPVLAFLIVMFPPTTLFLPFLMLAEAWRGSDPEGPVPDSAPGRIPTLILGWWFVFLAGLLLLLVPLIRPDPPAFVATVTALGALSLVGSAVVGFVVLAKLDARQMAAARVRPVFILRPADRSGRVIGGTIVGAIGIGLVVAGLLGWHLARELMDAPEKVIRAVVLLVSAGVVSLLGSLILARGFHGRPT